METAISFISKLLNTSDSVITLELDDVVFSKKHGHEIGFKNTGTLKNHSIFPALSNSPRDCLLFSREI